tara:strand:- start:2956 stop:3672 length:717 start_codon:yes stop_codon:yes gene_type:complete
MWVFGQPEHPMNYGLLNRLGKMDPIVGFTRVSSPRGNFYSAKDLYAEVYSFNASELGAYNGILKRSYLKNYIGKGDVVFLSGDFRVKSVQEMGDEDVFQSGLVVRGRSVDFPDAEIDLALPSQEMPEKFDLKTGEIFRVDESTTCAAVLNVERKADDVMVFTVVPLVTKTFADPPGPKPYEFGENAVINISTPEKIRLEPDRWPISGEVEQVKKKPTGLSTGDSVVDGESVQSEEADE